MTQRLFRSLTFLGTSSGVPTTYRNVSGYVLTFTDGAQWLFDCGEGTQHQFLRCSAVSLGRVERIFITHLHGDHSYGLPGLVCTLSNLWAGGRGRQQATPAATTTKVDTAAAAAPTAGAAATVRVDDDEEHDDDAPPTEFLPFGPSSDYLEIVGPQYLGKFLRTALDTSQAFFPFRYRVTELVQPQLRGSYTVASGSDLHPCEAPTRVVYGSDEGVYDGFCNLSGPSVATSAPAASAAAASAASASDASAVVADEWRMRAIELEHRVFSLGYYLSEPSTPGTFDVAAATRLGVPKGPLFSKLKGGEAVQVADPAAAGGTRTVKPDDVVGPRVPGRVGLLLGDTCNSDRALKIAKGADFVVHESTFDDKSAHLAVPRGHSTSRMAANFACRLEAKLLVLTHFSARFLPRVKDPGPIALLLAEADDECAKMCRRADDAAAVAPAAAAAATPVDSSAQTRRVPTVIAVDDFQVVDLSRGKFGSSTSAAPGCGPSAPGTATPPPAADATTAASGAAAKPPSKKP